MSKEPKTRSKGYARTSRIVRQAAGCPGSPYPIEVVDGDQAPVLAGHKFGWETRGGRTVYLPTAYSKKGWSNLVYRPSTRRIEVGRTWLQARGLEI